MIHAAVALALAKTLGSAPLYTVNTAQVGRARLRLEELSPAPSLAYPHRYRIKGKLIFSFNPTDSRHDEERWLLSLRPLEKIDTGGVNFQFPVQVESPSSASAPYLHALSVKFDLDLDLELEAGPDLGRLEETVITLFKEERV